MNAIEGGLIAALVVVAGVTVAARAQIPVPHYGPSIIKARDHTLTICSHSPFSADPGMMVCGSHDMSPSDAKWLRGWLDENFPAQK